MSWSATIIGTPEKVSDELEKQSSKLDGQSKIEFDEALPHIQFLIKQNFGENAPIIKLQASGHGYMVNGEVKNRQLKCDIDHIYGVIV